MLSILIPVYNEDVRSLVEELCRQGRGLMPFEVLCFDDGSKDEFKRLNSTLAKVEEVQYLEMEENKGRSKIRNLLADAAQGGYLLFMDCDSKVTKSDYLATYVNDLEKNTLLYGGRSYAPERPKDSRYWFHWEYGSSREQQNAVARQKNPYHSFMTNNFLIPASCFQNIRFDESLLQYGHEDTLFGMELKKRKIKMVHLENPLEHTGLETAEAFLRKTKKAIENLHKLVMDNKPVETRLLSAFWFLKKKGLSRPFLWFFSLAEKYIYKNIVSGKASMKVFDVYKLGLLLRIDKEK